MPPDNDDDDTLSFDSTATDRTWYTSAAPPADSLSVISSDDDDDEVNEEDFLTALNSNNNSPDIPEELAKLSCSTPVALDDGLGPLPAIKKSSSRTPSRRASRSSRASTPAAASPNHSYNLRNRPDIFVLKHESSIFRSFIQPGLVCGFSMMEQVMLCTVRPAENWLGSSMNHIQGWMNDLNMLLSCFRTKMSGLLRRL